MGFGSTMKAGAKYVDPRATVARQERREQQEREARHEPRRTRVMPLHEEPPLGSIEHWNAAPINRGLRRTATARLKARIVGNTHIDKGVTTWQINARRHSALQCLLTNAKSIPALRNVGQHELAELAQVMGQLRCAHGDLVIREGEAGNNFYIVEEGRFEARGADGLKFQQYGPGGYFGELALLHNAPRAASVACTSSEGGVLWALDRASFRHALMGVRLRQTAVHVPFLCHLSDDRLEELADAMFEVRCAAGDLVIRQGDVGDNMYLVEEGAFEACVLPAGARVPSHDVLASAGGGLGGDGLGADGFGPIVASYAQGSLFGERALMQNVPRAASVRCVEQGRLWAIDRLTFRKVTLGEGLAQPSTARVVQGEEEEDPTEAAAEDAALEAAGREEEWEDEPWDSEKQAVAQREFDAARRKKDLETLDIRRRRKKLRFSPALHTQFEKIFEAAEIFRVRERKGSARYSLCYSDCARMAA